MDQKLVCKSNFLIVYMKQIMKGVKLRSTIIIRLELLDSSDRVIINNIQTDRNLFELVFYDVPNRIIVVLVFVLHWQTLSPRLTHTSASSNQPKLFLCV